MVLHQNTHRTVTPGITASTTQTQGQGALSEGVNDVTTVAFANDTVTLPSAAPGLGCAIVNNGANALQIFPASGDDLGKGVNLPTTLNAGDHITYFAHDATNWTSQSAYDPNFVNAVRGVSDDPERRQVIKATINGSGTWQKKTSPTPFPVGATITIIATPQDDNGSHFFLRTRNITRLNFQLIAVNTNGSIHTGNAIIGIIAERNN